MWHGSDREGLDHPEGAPHAPPDAPLSLELSRSVNGNLGKLRPQRSAAPELDVSGSPPALVGFHGKAIEQDGLAYPSQSPKGKALRRPTRRQALDERREGRPFFVTTCQLGGRSSRAGRVWVSHGIHELPRNNNELSSSINIRHSSLVS
jgi:hypothetical protein